MDSLDIRILRAMFPDGVYRLRGVDPRLSAQSLGEKVGVNRITVARRLARWRSDGFWKRLVAFPNPDAFGSSFQMQGLLLEASRHRGRFESSLEAVLDPAFSFQTEDSYVPILLKETPSRELRRQRALQELGVCHIVTPPLDIPFVASEMSLSVRDWKIVSSLRRSGGGDWKTVAHEVGVTIRGLERRIARLIEGRALFFFPELDFRRSAGTVVWVGILMGVGVDADRVKVNVRKRYPDLLPVESVFPFERLLPPSGLPPVGSGFPFFLPVPVASSADELRREICAMPDVLEVLIGFPTQDTSYPHAFDTRIGAAGEPTAPALGIARPNPPRDSKRQAPLRRARGTEFANRA